jgi:ribosomal protein S27E
VPRSGALPPDAAQRRTWWTRERVLAGLKRFHREQGIAPTSTEEWHALTARHGARGCGKVRGRAYPSFYGVLRWWPTFRQAWEAAGVGVDRSWEAWTPTELWYLQEAIGIIPREEIARDLKRSDAAVKRKLYDLGLQIRDRFGWSVHRLERATQIPSHDWERYIAWGEIPVFKGTKVRYVDPGDLVVVQELDLEHLPPELEAAMRRSLRERLVKVLAGVDWRADRPHRPEQTVGRGRSGRWKRTPRPPGPKPNDLQPGEHVVVLDPGAGRPYCRGRVGLLHLVYWAGNHFSPRGGSSAPRWMGRVEFKPLRGPGRPAAAPRVTYSFPLEALARYADGMALPDVPLALPERPDRRLLHATCKPCGNRVVARAHEWPVRCAFCRRELLPRGHQARLRRAA